MEGIEKPKFPAFRHARAKISTENHHVFGQPFGLEVGLILTYMAGFQKNARIMDFFVRFCSKFPTLKALLQRQT